MAWHRGRSRTSDSAWKSLRRKAKSELLLVCAHCYRSEHHDGIVLELDHIVPAAEGGADELANLQWLCGDCHDRKTAAESARGNARRRARRRVYDRYAVKHPGLK